MSNSMGRLKVHWDTEENYEEGRRASRIPNKGLPLQNWMWCKTMQMYESRTIMWTKLTCMNCEIICLIHPRSSSKKKSKRRSEQREVEEMRYYNEHESGRRCKSYWYESGWDCGWSFWYTIFGLDLCLAVGNNRHISVYIISLDISCLHQFIASQHFWYGVTPSCDVSSLCHQSASVGTCARLELFSMAWMKAPILMYH